MAAFDANEETQLVRQAVAGSREAFEGLVRLHQAAVRWCLVRYVRDPAVADDLAQEVFVAAYQTLASCRSADNVRGWLVGIARNMAIQHVRAEIRRRRRERGPLATQWAQWRVEHLQQQALDEREQQRTFDALRHCLEQLAPESRRVVEEHYFGRVTVESIAARQGRAAGAVRMMLFRIRKALAECIHKNQQSVG